MKTGRVTHNGVSTRPWSVREELRACRQWKPAAIPNRGAPYVIRPAREHAAAAAAGRHIKKRTAGDARVGGETGKGGVQRESSRHGLYLTKWHAWKGIDAARRN